MQVAAKVFFSPPAASFFPPPSEAIFETQKSTEERELSFACGLQPNHVVHAPRLAPEGVEEKRRERGSGKKCGSFNLKRNKWRRTTEREKKKDGNGA